MKQDKLIEQKALFFENIYDDGKYFWFTEFNYNALFKMDKINWNVELVTFFENEDFSQERLYISTVLNNEKMFFVPHYAKEIAIYDLNKKKVEKKPVIQPRKKTCLPWERAKFFRTMIIKEKIYFIPYHYPGILCYDIKKDIFIYLDDWVDEIETKRVNKWGYFLEFEFVENKLILPCACADAVIILDIDKQKSSIINTKRTSYNCRFCGICYIQDFFYLVSADGTIFKRKLEKENEEVKVIKLKASGKDDIEFYPVRYMDDDIYLFPFKQNRGFRFNINTERAELIEWINEEKKFKNQRNSVLNAIIRDRKIYIETGNSHRFVEYDLDNKIKFEIQLFPSEKDCVLIEKKRQKEFLKHMEYGYIIEDFIFSLDYLLYEVLYKNTFMEKYKTNKNVKIGKKLYQNII